MTDNIHGDDPKDLDGLDADPIGDDDGTKDDETDIPVRDLPDIEDDGVNV